MINRSILTGLTISPSVALLFILNLVVLVHSNWSTEQDYFNGIEVLSDSDTDGQFKDFHILEDFRFKPFSDDLPSEYQVYGYESYFEGD